MALTRFNKGGVRFDIDMEGMESHKASEVYKEIGEAPLLMRAVLINKDAGYGQTVTVVTTNSVIFFGKCNVETAQQIREDPEAVKELNEKGAYFKIREFVAKNPKNGKPFSNKGYSFEFLEESEYPQDLKDDDPVFRF